MPSKDPQFVSIGRVGKPHGLKGAFFVERPSEDSERFAVGATVLVNGVAAAVVESKVSGGRPVIRLDCEVTRGAELQIERTQLPPLPEDTYYAFQLGGRKLGRIKEVVSGVANDVLELDSGLALPMVEDCISLVDLAAARIVVHTGFAEPS